MTTKIEWCEETWNPITGCTPISEGCQNCYAKRMATRLAGRFGYDQDEPFRVTFHSDKLDQPLRWKKSRRIFVCSMGDILHQDVEPLMFALVLNTIKKCPQHTFLLLTKRPERMINDHLKNAMIVPYFEELLPNLWLGVTCENQQRADERIPILLQIPAAVRFVSIEPMLGPVDLSIKKYMQCNCPSDYWENGGHNIYCPHGDKYIGKRIDWVICGGETGPGARPMHPDWARSLRNQCQTAPLPFFFKQWGEWVRADQTNTPYDKPYKVHYFKRNRYSKFGEIDPDVVARMGKKKAGRLLDGREWNEYPEVGT